MPPTHSSQAAVAAAYRTLIAHETEPKEQDFYRTRLQRLEQATEPECEFDCRSRVAAAGVGVYCPQCSAKCAETDLTTQLAKAIRAAWVDRLDWDELAQGALEFLTAAGRLIPSGGMALTAEQVEDVKIVLGQLERGGLAFEAAHERLRALFPATEPAYRCDAVSVHGDRCFKTFGHDDEHRAGKPDVATYGWDSTYPAPAEPAEEETKAEACELAIETGMNLVDWDLIPERGDPKEAAHYVARGALKAYASALSKVNENDLSALLKRLVADARASGHYDDPSKLAGYAEGIEHAYLALHLSSPVVPAPTETEGGNA